MRFVTFFIPYECVINVRTLMKVGFVAFAFPSLVSMIVKYLFQPSIYSICFPFAGIINRKLDLMNPPFS